MEDTDKREKKSIVLIGFMGSGKTTVGLRLSWKLRLPVEDTDKLIEKKEGCTISQIFEREGEEAFRKKETELLRQLAESRYLRILSAGGGTPVRKENRPLLRQCGTVVYLRVRPETVYERLKGDASRPLLQCGDPLERIKSLLAERREAYESSADVILDADDLDSEECAEMILRRLRQI